MSNTVSHPLRGSGSIRKKETNNCFYRPTKDNNKITARNCTSSEKGITDPVWLLKLCKKKTSRGLQIEKHVRTMSTGH